MFGGLTKTSSRIAIAAALGMTLGGFAMSASPAKAADLGGDCCADLEERVAELEATTVRKGNKKVSVTLSGWVVKLGSWWDDGHESNFYVGDKDTTLSSHFQISGSATISPGWSAGYTIAVETAGTSASVGFCENQFNDNCALFGDINTLLSYMWVKSDTWGTINWGQLSQATDNVALLPDLSGTVIESNAVVFDGAGMFVRTKGAKNSQDLASEFAWGAVLTCNSAGGGLGADCNGYPQNAFRYDTPTWGGFSASTSYGEDDMWDVAVKYAADWNSVKVSAAAGYTHVDRRRLLQRRHPEWRPDLQQRRGCRRRRRALPELSAGCRAVPGRRLRPARSLRPVRLWPVSERPGKRHAVQERYHQQRAALQHWLWTEGDLKLQRQHSRQLPPTRTTFGS